MKVWAYVALFIVIIGGIGAAWKAAHTAGYNKRDREVQQEIIKAQEAARLDEENKWRDTVAAAEAQIIEKETIVEKIRVVEKEIPKVVEKIIVKRPECADLGVDFISVLNKHIDAANGNEVAEAAPGVVAEVP